jgi:hypothetical protein
MIPSSMKFSMEGATPTFEDNDGQTITAGGHVRLRIKGIRSELNQMFAIGSIREDYLGYELAPLSEQVVMPVTDRCIFSVLCSTSRCSDITDTTNPNFFGSLQLHGGSTATVFSCSCYSGVPQIWTSARRWRHGAREKAKREKQPHQGEESYVYVFHVIKQDTQSEQQLFVQSSRSPLHLTNPDLPSTSPIDQ